MSWTARFWISVGLGGLFLGSELNWLGALPGTTTNLVAQATALALFGLFALRGSALGMAIALFVAIWVLTVDQATLAIGVVPLRFTPPADYWTTEVLRSAVTWAAYPLLARAFALRLPTLARGLAALAALVLLPFIRFNDWQAVAMGIIDPRTGQVVLLSVPWLPLALLTAALVSAALVWTQARLVRRPLALAAAGLLMVAVLAPAAVAAVQASAEVSGVRIEPNHGGPLTTVVASTRIDQAGDAELRWSGETLPPSLLSAGVSGPGSRRASFLPAVATDLSPGPHEIVIAVGALRRTGNFELLPPSDLSIALEDGHVVISGGPPARACRVFTIGPGGTELIDVVLDARGSWRSPLAVPSGLQLRVVAQSGTAWAQRELP